MAKLSDIRDLISCWRNATLAEKIGLIEERDLKPVMGQFGTRIGLMQNVRQNPNEYFPALNENAELVFISGFPNTQLLSLSEMALTEARQFQLVGIKEDDTEERSKWYDDEETVSALQKELENTEEFTSLSVVKRIKELEYDEDEEETATLESYIEKKKT
jgi:hypothetical protein